MMLFLEWLYNTIPFAQLMGTRANIIGLVWFLFIMGVTFRHLMRNNYSLGIENKYLHIVGLSGITVLLTWVFYRVMDICLALFAFALNKPQLVGNFSYYFWFAECFDITLVLLAIYYLFHVLKLKPYFTISCFSIFLFSLTLYLQSWIVTNFSIDYAGLFGSERIRVFWSYYPQLYTAYACLYFTLLKRRKPE